LTTKRVPEFQVVGCRTNVSGPPTGGRVAQRHKRKATHAVLLIASSEGAARKVNRDSRRAINFNSWSAPIMANRSTQASIVRAFFIATSNTCVRLSVMIGSPYFCVLNCSTSATRCGGIGGARAS